MGNRRMGRKVLTGQGIEKRSDKVLWIGLGLVLILVHVLFVYSILVWMGFIPYEVAAGEPDWLRAFTFLAPFADILLIAIFLLKPLESCCCCESEPATQANGLCEDCAKNCTVSLLKDKPCRTIHVSEHERRRQRC